MSTILLEDGYRFYFYMNEHLPIHIHVKKGGANGRIILKPAIDFHRNYGFKPSEVNKIMEIVIKHYDYNNREMV